MIEEKSQVSSSIWRGINTITGFGRTKRLQPYMKYIDTDGRRGCRFLSRKETYIWNLDCTQALSVRRGEIYQVSGSECTCRDWGKTTPSGDLISCKHQKFWSAFTGEPLDIMIKKANIDLNDLPPGCQVELHSDGFDHDRDRVYDVFYKNARNKIVPIGTLSENAGIIQARYYSFWNEFDQTYDAVCWLIKRAGYNKPQEVYDYDEEPDPFSLYDE